MKSCVCNPKLVYELGYTCTNIHKVVLQYAIFHLQGTLALRV